MQFCNGYYSNEILWIYKISTYLSFIKIIYPKKKEKKERKWFRFLNINSCK